jgi:hypothetical protein
VGADGAPREGAGQITASGTYWLSAAPMAAALATLKLLEAGAGTSFAQISATCTACSCTRPIRLQFPASTN